MKAAGIMYTVSYVRKVPDSMEFSRNVMIQVHVNASNDKECSKWYVDISCLILRLKRLDFTVIVESESFFKHDMFAGKSCGHGRKAGTCLIHR